MAEASRILVHAIELWAQDSVFFHSDPFSVMLMLVWVPKLAGETAGVSVCLRIKKQYSAEAFTS